MSDLLSIEEAAPKIGLRPHSLRELCRKKMIRHMKVGPNCGLYRFRQEWLDDYLESCTHGPEEKKKRRPRENKPGPAIRSLPKAESEDEQLARIRKEMKEKKQRRG